MYFTNNAIAPYKHKRRIDSVRRHNDGLKEIGVKIKQKAHELASYFKQLPNSKKIVLVISQIAKIVSAILVVSASKELGSKTKTELLKVQLQDRIDKLKALADLRQKMFGAETPGVQSINARIGERQKELENANKIQQQSDTRFKLKLFIGLATGFAALIGDIFSISGNKQSELQRRDSAIALRDESLKDKLLIKANNLLQTIKRMPGMEKLKFALTSLIAFLSGKGAVKSTIDLVSLVRHLEQRRQEIAEQLGTTPDSIGMNVATRLGVALKGIIILCKTLIATKAASKAAEIYARNSEGNVQRSDSAIKRMIDRKVRKALIDAGVKGMKRGQHVKARDPEYVESLRGGGGISTGKKIAIGAGALAAGLGGVLLARKGKFGLFKRSLSRLKGKENPSDVFEAIGPQTQKAVVPPTAAVSKHLNETQKAVNKINSQFGESFDNFMRNRNNKIVFE